MENKKIWHTPDENPNTFNVYPILVLYEAGDTPEIMSSKDYFQLTYDRYVNRWCYWDEFIKSVDATSKALDVATNALKQIQWFCYAPTMGERAGRMQECADKTLTEISKIMKGA